MLATTATFSSDLSPFTKVPVTFRKPDSSVGFSSTALTGQLSWSAMTGDAAAAGVPAAFKSFCIEGLQRVAPGQVSFPTLAPTLDAAPLGSGSPIGGERAALLTAFWRQYGPATPAGFTDNTDAAAFQLAVWEITNDARSAGSRIVSDLTTGQFSVNAAGRSLPAVLRAQQWLAAFDATAPAKNSVVLYALQSPTAQDQVTCVPGPVDLDVDSNNDGTIDPDNGPAGTDDRIEAEANRPGVIVAVGGDRTQMIVEVPAGRTVSLAITQGAGRVQLYAQATDGTQFDLPLAITAPQGTNSTTLTYWIQAVAPSTSIADIAFTLTTTDSGPASSDTVRATALAVDLDVGLDLEVVEDGGVVSADQAGAWYGADATIAFGPSPIPMPVPDGTVIEWTTTGPNGRGSPIKTPTSSGYASFLMQAGTHAGDVYGVSARVVEIPFAGTVLRLPSRANTGDSVIVVPGLAAAYEFSWSRPSIAADGTSRSEATVTIRDRFGNLVADGTPVAWTLNGAATIVSGDSQTTAGKARALIQATDLAGGFALTAAADGTEGTGSCDATAVNIALTADSQSAVLGSNAAVELTARVTDATGANVADGTPIHWFSRCGRVAGAATVQNGVARATLTVRDGTLRAGNHVVAALVGRAVGKVTVQFTSPDGRLFATVDQSLLSGDVVEDGTLAVEQFDGTSIARPYFHQTAGYVFNGPANGIVRVAIDPAGAAQGVVTINGQAGQADIACGPDGTATFLVRCTGEFRGNGAIRLQLTATVVADGDSQAVDPFTANRTWGQWTWGMAVAAYDTAAYVVDTAAHVTWGAVTGEADSNAALAGDVTVSAIPIVGVVADVRDVLKELCFMLPGGRAPDHLVLTLSLLGLATEAFPPADYLPDVLKVFAKVLKVNGPFFQAVQSIAERLVKTRNFQEALDFKALLTHLAFPPDITTLRFLDDSIIRAADDLASLNRLSKLTDPGTIVGLLKSVGEKHGAGAAKNLFGNLATLTDAQLTVLKDANRLNLVGEAVAKAGWGSSQLGKYADNVKELKPNNPALKLFDEFADVTGSGLYLGKTAKPLDDVGVQNELKVAKIKRDSGDPIEKLQEKIDTPGVKGEIDVVSKSKAIEVKTSPDNGDFDDWKGQVMRLVKYAKAKGLEAEYWHQNPIHPDRLTFLTDSGVKAFTIP